ncbi:hypothetical protein AArcMg_2127 [Natrarchaeobaculum sulfurireducens]|uniref:Uncharacterized protein n=2 Tax=Natrarchaeobaculum sulfurireducens TaxID=2044521 RepID=A0A346PRI0_9EURY|nr:hypothetical protein AArcMg_2127 [Natrarchaeobaculum sulfurireducens]
MLSMSETTSDDLEELLTDAEECLENVEDCLGGVESIEELDDETLETVLGDVETLTQVATAVENLLETLDFGDLPDAVDGDELLEALEVGEVPAVIADDETGASDLVDFTQLFRAIDLLSAWDATELGELWEGKRELEDAVDDLGDGEDAGLLEGAVPDVAGDDSLVGDDEELLETDLDASDVKEALGKPDPEEDPEAYQVFIQEQAMEGIDAFRAALLETHEKFERLVEYNRERMRRTDTSASSRNPTAASTMPTQRAAVGSGVKHTTVPQDVRLSTAPSRKRIYGQRFEREREKQRSETQRPNPEESEND